MSGEIPSFPQEPAQEPSHDIFDNNRWLGDLPPKANLSGAIREFFEVAGTSMDTPTIIPKGEEQDR